MRPQDGLRLMLLAAIWGGSYPLIKVALEGFGSLTIVGLRVCIGAAVLALILKARRLSYPGREVLPTLVVMALVANILPFFLIAWGEERITSALAAILNSTTPLFTVLIAMFLLREERSGPLRLTGIVLGFVGVGVIVERGGGPSSLLGDLAIVVAALCYAIGFVIARKNLTGRGYSSLSISAAQLVVAAAIMIPVLIASLVFEPVRIDLGVSLAVLVLGALGTGFAYLLYYRLVSDTGATTASFVTYLIPVFGAAFGWIFLDERLGWGALIGAALVIGGILLAERGRARLGSAPASSRR